MNKPMVTTGAAYFDLNLRLTTEQLDEVVKQELMAQLNAPDGIPQKTLDAMVEVLMWYVPQTEAAPYQQAQERLGDDWKRYIQ